VSDATTTTPATAAETKPGKLARFAAWAVAHRLKLYGIIGFAGMVFVCPALPTEYQGTCRMVSQALRIGTFDGLSLP
jgi:hypothetical protein